MFGDDKRSRTPIQEAKATTPRLTKDMLERNLESRGSNRTMAESVAASSKRRSSMDDKMTKMSALKSRVATEAPDAESQLVKSPYTRNIAFTKTMQPQKKHDDDAVSVFSQAIESVRTTKGKLLINTSKR